jgi:hypothetical protein
VNRKRRAGSFSWQCNSIRCFARKRAKYFTLAILWVICPFACNPTILLVQGIVACLDFGLSLLLPVPNASYRGLINSNCKFANVACHFTQSIANNETQRTCSVVENNFPLFIFHFPFLLQVLFSLNKGDNEFNWHFPIS